MTHLFVFDTVSFINYHFDFFDEKLKLSKNVVDDIKRCLSPDFLDYKLIIPSIVFVEIFDKQLKTDEKASKFKSEILSVFLDSDDVEIKGLDAEILEIFYNIDNDIIKLETHDKLILSSAIQMKAKLITNDEKIKTYIDTTGEVEIVF
ncbi:PIN domain-containing protein [Pedobacter rhodius]|uniref:PIN domain-containing protein n=1 Tax=Pedobacter rhodius TaxID=3004098 RepID=A0ABT4KVP9_9SPHI|nr:PIN domain-containing protein [Pedobacter sp. SJ11]MCZ4221938.1 hypothetical protein [Pedobacter sp. SJ11]